MPIIDGYQPDPATKQVTTAELGIREPPPICPICEMQADGLDDGYFHGIAIRCLTHGEFEFSRSIEERTRTRDDWETALRRAQHRTNAGRLPDLRY